MPSSILSKKLNDEPQSVALIPASEIITNRELFVSGLTGISFEGQISNSFIYFESEKRKITDVKLAGDISSMEVILSKILFKEFYNSDIKINILTQTSENIIGTHLIAGDGNFANSNYEKGFSLAEQIVELISAPFVNYVLASNDADALKQYSAKINTAVTNLNYDVNRVFDTYESKVATYLKENFNTVVYNFDEQDRIGLTELLRLPYYHGLIEDIVNVKFV